MADFCIKLADTTVNIITNSSFAQDFCKDYLTNETNAKITAKADRQDVLKEIDNVETKPSFDYAEILCIYREIAEALPKFDAFVMHGAAISYNGSGYIFTAPSQTGKTTHLRLWQKYVKGTEIINGDKPILKYSDNSFTVYGTPWSGKEKLNNNIKAPLKAICLLKRGRENKIYRVEPQKNFAALLNQIYLPKDESSAVKTLELFSKLVCTVPIYILECDISENAVKVSFEGLTGESYSKGSGICEN